MNFPFASSDPNAESVNSFKPPRLVSSKADSKDVEDIHAGENQLYIVPSCSNYRDFAANGWQGYLPGAFYTRVRIKAFGDRFANYLRAPAKNHVTDAFWKLFDALCPNKTLKGTLLDKLKDAGFDGGLDHRCLLNIVRNTQNGLSRLKWFDVGAERPNADMSNATRKRLLTQCMEALKKVYDATQGQVVGFELERAALLNLGVQFNSGIAQYSYVMPVSGQQGMVISDLLQAIPDFQMEHLDEACAWAAETDELPALDQIPALVECPEACDILGLQTSRVPGNPAQVAPGFTPQYAPAQPPAPQYAPAQPPPVQAPPVQAPQVQAPQYEPAQPPPVQAPPVQAPQVQAPQPEQLSTMSAPSAAAASTDFAAQLNAQLNQQQQPDPQTPGPASF